MTRRLRDILTDLERASPDGLRLVAELLTRLRDVDDEECGRLDPVGESYRERNGIRFAFAAIQRDIR